MVKTSQRLELYISAGRAALVAMGVSCFAYSAPAVAQSYHGTTAAQQDCFSGQGISLGTGGQCQQVAVVKPSIAPKREIIVPRFNHCGPSSVSIFDVDVSQAPEPLERLGTLPEFGDSHGLTPTEFIAKLHRKYRENSHGDRAYLDYLFRSLGYSGFDEIADYMVSDDVLPIGTRGLMGFGKSHSYGYYILPTSDHDRQAFRIQGANGTIVHFVKTCGNYFYACN